MSDIEAIQQLLNAYHMAAVLGDYEEMAETYLPDGVWHIRPIPARLVGPEEIVAKAREVEHKYEFVFQQASPAHIVVDGDRATARSVVRESGKVRGSDATTEVFGHYSDELVRTDEGWKFALREFRMLGIHEYETRPPNRIFSHAQVG